MKTILPSAISLALIAPSIAAQDLAGQVIVAAFNPAPWHPRNGVRGGLFVVHPRTPGTPAEVQGLPLEITGNVGATPFDIGLGSVLVLPNGDLLVGENTPLGHPGVDSDVEVHRVRLTRQGNVWNGQVMQSFLLGNVLSGAPEVSAMVMLPSGEVLLAVNFGAVSAPVNGATLATLDLTTGAVTPWTVTGFPAGSTLNALAVSGDGLSLFVGEFDNLARGNVWRAALPALSNSVAVTALTNSQSMGGVYALDIDNQHQVVVGTFGANGGQGTAPSLHLVDPSTGAVTDLLPSTSGVRNAVVVERNTDAANAEAIASAGVRLDIVLAGTQNTLVAGPTAPWGLVAGLAMIPAVDSFGSQSTCVSTGSYEWQTAPNPGGLPLIGNASFSITLQTPSPQPLCVFQLGWGDQSASPLPSCAQLLLDPAQFVYAVLMAPPNPSTSFTLPIDLSNAGGLAGLQFFAQTFYLGSGSPVLIESSPGVSVTIL